MGGWFFFIYIYINYVGMAGCFKYKHLLCIRCFCKVIFFFLFSFGDILAAADDWVKLLRTFCGRSVLYAERHGRQHELLGTLCNMP